MSMEDAAQLDKGGQDLDSTKSANARACSRGCLHFESTAIGCERQSDLITVSHMAVKLQAKTEI